MMKVKWLLFFSFLVFFVSVQAQEPDRGVFDYASVGIQYYRGSCIGNTFERLRDSDPFSIEMYFQRQVNVSPAWNHTKRLPRFGFGVFASNSGSKKYVGAIVCAYPYIKLPLLTTGALHSDFRIGFGLGWVQKPYDKYSNPENLLLSQKLNPHTNISWQNEVRLAPHHYVDAALSFFHVSNAKTSLPNLGINIPAVSLGYRYAFSGGERKPGFALDSIDPKPSLRIFLSGGIKQMQVPDSSYYGVEVVTGELAKWLSYSSSVSLGMFITHDESVKTDPLVKHLGPVKTSQVALYASYEYHFGRLSIPVQLGQFVYNGNSKLIEAIGCRYRMSPHWIAEMMLKAHLHRADLMHFGLGYRF